MSVKGSDYLRIDIGEYRVVYRVEGDTVKIALVGKRNDSDAYRQLSQLGFQWAERMRNLS